MAAPAPGRSSATAAPSRAAAGASPPEQWKVLIRENHVGYISWEDYEQNQRLLEANGAMREGQTGGAAKRGSALLSGLLRCGRCGRPLFVAYSGPGGRVPRYAC